jgi:hypothetical protein
MHRFISRVLPFTRKEIRTHTERKKSKSEVSHNVIEKKFEKSNSGDKYGHIMNNFRFQFFRYLYKKLLYAYTENILKRLPDSASRGVDNSPTRRVGELATYRLAESGSHRLSDSPNFHLNIQKPTLRLGESFFNYEYLRKFEAESKRLER